MVPKSTNGNVVIMQAGIKVCIGDFALSLSMIVLDRDRHEKTWCPIFLHLHNKHHNTPYQKNQQKYIGYGLTTLYLC